MVIMWYLSGCFFLSKGAGHLTNAVFGSKGQNSGTKRSIYLKNRAIIPLKGPKFD
jgi:hypothetical protein